MLCGGQGGGSCRAGVQPQCRKPRQHLGLQKASLPAERVDLALAGDLQAQCPASGYALRELGVPDVYKRQLESSARSDVSSAIQSAKDEYHALPASQRTFANKVRCV